MYLLNELQLGPYLPRAFYHCFQSCTNLLNTDALLTVMFRCPLACQSSRPFRWWRSTRSSKMTSLCLTPSGWLKTIALRRRKKVRAPASPLLSQFVSGIRRIYYSVLKNTGPPGICFIEHRVYSKLVYIWK